MTSLEDRKPWFALALIVAAQSMAVLHVAIVDVALIALLGAVAAAVLSDSHPSVPDAAEIEGEPLLEAAQLHQKQPATEWRHDTALVRESMQTYGIGAVFGTYADVRFSDVPAPSAPVSRALPYHSTKGRTR